MTAKSELQSEGDYVSLANLHAGGGSRHHRRRARPRDPHPPHARTARLAAPRSMEATP